MSSLLETTLNSALPHAQNTAPGVQLQRRTLARITASQPEISAQFSRHCTLSPTAPLRMPRLVRLLVSNQWLSPFGRISPMSISSNQLLQTSYINFTRVLSNTSSHGFVMRSVQQRSMPGAAASLQITISLFF